MPNLEVAMRQTAWELNSPNKRRDAVETACSKGLCPAAGASAERGGERRARALHSERERESEQRFSGKEKALKEEGEKTIMENKKLLAERYVIS